MVRNWKEPWSLAKHCYCYVRFKKGSNSREREFCFSPFVSTLLPLVLLLVYARIVLKNFRGGVKNIILSIPYLLSLWRFPTTNIIHPWKCLLVVQHLTIYSDQPCIKQLSFKLFFKKLINYGVWFLIVFLWAWNVFLFTPFGVSEHEVCNLIIYPV